MATFALVKSLNNLRSERPRHLRQPSPSKRQRHAIPACMRLSIGKRGGFEPFFARWNAGFYGLCLNRGFVIVSPASPKARDNHIATTLRRNNSHDDRAQARYNAIRV